MFSVAILVAAKLVMASVNLVIGNAPWKRARVDDYLQTFGRTVTNTLTGWGS